MRALEQAVREAVGEASACWVETPEGRQFDSERAVDVSNRLIGEIQLRQAIHEDLLYDAFAIMANVGDWNEMPTDWHEAAVRWRARWHAMLSMSEADA